METPTAAHTWALVPGPDSYATKWRHTASRDEWDGGFRRDGDHHVPFGDGNYLFANTGLQVSGTVHGNMERLEFSGHGVMEWPDGSHYKGQLSESTFDGKGRFTWSNGDVYDGVWRDGKRHAFGIFETQQAPLTGLEATQKGCYAHLMRYAGEWVDDLMQGNGEIQYFDAPGKHEDIGERVADAEANGHALPAHGKLLRKFTGAFKGGLPTVGKLQTPSECFDEVKFDGASDAGSLATWYWAPSPSGCARGGVLVDLDPLGEEYRAACSRFMASMPPIDIGILKIQRVQNDDLRCIYDLQQRALEKRVTGAPRFLAWNTHTMERLAFHAPVCDFVYILLLLLPLLLTCVHTPHMQGNLKAAVRIGDPAPWESIVEEGFQATLAGSDNGKVYGAGIYFAKDASLAHKYAVTAMRSSQANRPLPAAAPVQRDDDREQKEPLRMFLSRIVTGVYTGASQRICTDTHRLAAIVQSWRVVCLASSREGALLIARASCSWVAGHEHPPVGSERGQGRALPLAGRQYNPTANLCDQRQHSRVPRYAHWQQPRAGTPVRAFVLIWTGYLITYSYAARAGAPVHAFVLTSARFRQAI
jgi:hypothetical protein